MGLLAKASLALAVWTVVAFFAAWFLGSLIKAGRGEN